MKIDKNNYEAFFLDFVEGRLDDSSTLEMLAFLRNHPQLKEELESFTEVKLAPSEEVYVEKEFLKKMDFSNSLVNPNNFDDYCIAYYEKLLSPSESEKLFSYLENFPGKRSDFQQYGKAILKADKNIVFEAKPFLKKKPKGTVRTIILRWTAVAAGIVLAISIFYKAPVNKKVSIPKAGIVASVNTIEPNTPETSVNTEAKKFAGTKKVIFTEPVKSYLKSIPPTEAVEQLSYLEPINIVSVKEHDFKRPELLASNIPVIEDKDEDEMELLDYAEKIWSDNILKENNRKKPRKKLTLWNIAEVTLKGYNSLSEKDIVLRRETDENGKLTAVAVETDNRVYGFETKN